MVELDDGSMFTAAVESLQVSGGRPKGECKWMQLTGLGGGRGHGCDVQRLRHQLRYAGTRAGQLQSLMQLIRQRLRPPCV